MMQIYLHPCVARNLSKRTATVANICHQSGCTLRVKGLRVYLLPTHTPSTATHRQPVISGPTGGDAA